AIERTRDTWARAGVLVNELARPVLFLNLPTGAPENACWRRGEPAYLSLRALLRSPPSWDVAGEKNLRLREPQPARDCGRSLGVRLRAACVYRRHAGGCAAIPAIPAGAGGGAPLLSRRLRLAGTAHRQLRHAGFWRGAVALRRDRLRGCAADCA